MICIYCLKRIKLYSEITPLRIRTDIKYGLLAWAISLANIIVPYPEIYNFSFKMKTFVHPAAWVLCIIMMLASEKGKPSPVFGWVLLSAPLAFYYVFMVAVWLYYFFP